MHKHYKKQHIRGEWFKYDDELRKDVKMLRLGCREEGLVWDKYQSRTVLLNDE